MVEHKIYTLDEIAALVNAITPGEWRVGSHHPDMTSGVLLGDDGYIYDEGGHTRDDAEFIAAAPAIIRQLIERQTVCQEFQLLIQEFGERITGADSFVKEGVIFDEVRKTVYRMMGGLG